MVAALEKVSAATAADTIDKLFIFRPRGPNTHAHRGEGTLIG